MLKIIFTFFCVLVILSTHGQAGTLNKNFGNNGIVKTVINNTGTSSTFNVSARNCFVLPTGKLLAVLNLGGSCVISQRLSTGVTDSSYGKNGFSVAVDVQNPYAALQTDGKVIVVGATEAGAQDFIIARFTTNGSLDATFGNSGVTITDAGSEEDALFGVTVQSNGAIVAGGVTFRNGVSDFALIRYTAAGKVDAGFGQSGLVVTNFGNTSSIAAVAIQPDNKIVAAGNFNNGNSYFAVARYKTNGSLDTSFNHTGMLISSSGNVDNATSMLLSSGKILIGGYYYLSTGGSHFEIARFTSGGKIDSTFNGTGWATGNFGNPYEFLFALQQQLNGKIIAGGYIEPQTGNAAFAVTRFSTAGVIDSSFGTNGYVLTSLTDSTSDFLTCLFLQPNGEILAGGYSAPQTAFFDFSLVRYNSNGSLDNGFSHGGILEADDPDQSINYSYIFLEPDGKLVAPGQEVQGSNVQNFISRFTAKGVIDPSYGQNGTAKTTGFYNIMQTDGKVVEAGNGNGVGGGAILMTRYLVDGNVDSSYGTNGSTTVDFFGDDEFPGSMITIQPDNKVIVGGFISNSTGIGEVLVARFNTNGMPDASFGTGGAVTANFGQYNNVQTIAVAPTGKILAGGTGLSPSFQLFCYLARFKNNGNIDSSFGQNGFLTFNSGMGDFAGDVIPLANGKILFSYESTPDFFVYNSYVTRLNANGSVDSSFGTNGIIAVVNSVITIEPDQKILVMGRALDPQDNTEFVLARYLTNGSPDLSFGTSGVTESNLSPIYDAISSAVVTGNQLAVAGGAQDPNSIGILAEYGLGPQPSTAATADLTVPTDPGTCTTVIKGLDKKISGATTDTAAIYTLSGVSEGSVNGSLNNYPFNKGTTKITYRLAGDTAAAGYFTLNVVDKEAPVIGSIGKEMTDHFAADNFLDLRLGYDVTDNCGTTTTTVSSTGESQMINDHYLRLSPTAGVYTFRLTATDESGNQSSREDTVMIPESMRHLPDDLVIIPSPNPSNNFFSVHVRSTKVNSPVLLQLFNDKGVLLQTVNEAMPGQSVKIGEGVIAGVYFLKALQQDRIKMIRLVKM